MQEQKSNMNPSKAKEVVERWSAAHDKSGWS